MLGPPLAPAVRRQVLSPTWFPRPEFRSAGWDCQDWAGRTMPLSTGHACPALADLLVSWVEAQDKLAPGGWEGRGAAGPADKVYVSALHPGWQGPGKQTQPPRSLPFFGCFSNLHDSFFPRLIAQSQAARTTGHEPSCHTATGIYPFYSLLRPLFALVWKGLDHLAGVGSSGK